MKILLKTSFILILLISFSAASHAQQAKYNSLNKRMAVLYKNGKNRDAIIVAKQVIEVAEETFGRKHAYYSASLENLALLHMAEKDYADAESLYEESLGVRESLLGKEDPGLIKVLEKIKECLEEQGKLDKVASIESRLEKIKALQ